MTRCAWIALFGALVAFAQQASAQGADNFSATRRGAGSPLTHTPIVSTDAQAALQTALERYRQIAADGGWPAIDKGVSLRAGDADERVGALRRRLAVEGDLAAAYASGTEFDGNVEDALKRFQGRNGLRASGILNGETLRALNVSAAARLAQLTSSAERLAELLPLTEQGPTCWSTCRATSCRWWPKAACCCTAASSSASPRRPPPWCAPPSVPSI